MGGGERTSTTPARFEGMAASLLELVDGHQKVVFAVLPPHRVDRRVVLHEQELVVFCCFGRGHASFRGPLLMLEPLCQGLLQLKRAVVGLGLW